MNFNSRTKKQIIEELKDLHNQLAKNINSKDYRKPAKKALLEDKETFRTLAENANDGILVATGKGVHAYANKRASEITGYSVAELLNMGIKDLAHPDELKKLIERYKQRLAGKFVRSQYETAILRKDGNSLPIELSAAKTLWYGQPADLVIIRDISDRKRIEEALRAERDKVRQYLDIAEVMLIVINKKAEITLINRKGAQILGYEEEDLLGKNWFKKCLPLNIRKEVKGVFRELIAGEKKINTFYENPVLTKSGTERIIAWHNILLKDEQGNIIGTLSSGEDITERKQAEQALQESEEKYRNLVERANDGIGIAQDGIMKYANLQLARMIGYSAEELVGSPFTDFFIPDEVPKVVDRYKRRIAGENIPSVYESALRHRDGNRVDVELNAGIVVFEGRPADLVVARDITDRKKAEKELYRSRHDWENIFQAIGHPTIIIDKEYNIIKANYATVKAAGSPEEEIIGKKCYELFHFGEQPSLGCPLKKMLASGRLETAEMEIEALGGIYLVSCTPVYDEAGNLQKVIHIANDITKSKLVEKELRESEEKYRELINGMNDTAWVIDFNEKFIDVNNAAVDVLGYSREELLSMGPHDIDTTLKAEEITDLIQRMSTDKIQVFETTHTGKYGKTIPVEIKSSLVTYHGKRAILSIARDITERKLAEKETEALREQLRQSQKMEAIGRLAGGIAHDFNNLLTIIKGYSQLSLIELKEDSSLKGNIEQINKATDKASEFIRQLLAFSRRQILEMKVLDVNAVLRNLNDMLYRLIGENIELTMRLAENLGRVKSDSGWLEQAIMNLVVNARDAMASGGEIIIETGNAYLDEAYVSGHAGMKQGRFVMLSVSDNGTGMTPEVRERLFEPFYSTKEKDKGTGLGLSTVYGIVNQSGGDISVYSEPGKGTTFKIYLPAVDEPLEEEKEKEQSDILFRGNETILLVEDENSLRELIIRVLAEQGYKVLAAGNGNEAIDICRQHKEIIHLILTDIVMPGMNGLELVKRMESVRPEINVVFMSGYMDDVVFQHQILEEGVNYITKPFTVENLSKIIRRSLDQ